MVSVFELRARLDVLDPGGARLQSGYPLALRNPARFASGCKTLAREQI